MKTVTTKQTKTRTTATKSSAFETPDAYVESTIAAVQRREREEHSRKYERAQQQIADEAAAFRKRDRLDAEAPKTLSELIAAVTATSEDGSSHTFLFGAMTALADDLDVLYNAISDDGGHLVDHGFDLEKLPTILWRLAQRAHAAAEISERWQAAATAAEAAVST